MDIRYLRGLLSSYPAQSQISSQFINWLSQPQHSVRVLQPIQIKNISQNNQIQISAVKNIPSKSQIMLISSEKCFTNVELIGCSVSKSQDISNSASAIGHKYYSSDINQAYQASGLLKLILQLYVHKQDANLNHSSFAQYLMSQKVLSPFFWSPETKAELYSPHILRIVKSTHQQFQQMAEDLKDHKIYGITNQNIFPLLQAVRRNILCFTPSYPKHFTTESLQVMCPLISQIQHSFDPNCSIDGCYLSHENQSFVSLNSLKEIQQGEVLTINYGNLPNHDFLMRYGFLVKDNQFNQVAIDLDFQSDYSYSDDIFDLKQKLLSQSSIKDIENQILYSNKMNLNLLKHLRIYFLREKDIQENLSLATRIFDDFADVLIEVVNSENEMIVQNFLERNIVRLQLQYEKNKMKLLKLENIENNLIIKGVELGLNSLQDIDLVKDGEYKMMLQICLEEEDTIKKNLTFVRNNIKKLVKGE